MVFLRDRRYIGSDLTIYRTRTSGYRLDLLCSIQFQNNRKYAAGSFWSIRSRVFIDTDRAEFFSNNTQDACSWYDMDENASVPLDAICNWMGTTSCYSDNWYYPSYDCCRKNITHRFF